VGSLLRVLVCSEKDWRPDLAPTLIGRQGIEVYRVEKFADAKLVGSSLGAQLVLVDRDLPDSKGFIEQLRKDPAMQKRSIGVLARGAMEDTELDLLGAGANAVFRVPPDADWDARLARLLKVPQRQQARLVVHIEVETAPECAAAILNLSSGGMLLATHQGLAMGAELTFRFRLPDKSEVKGRGRVARAAPPTGYGVEFLDLDGDGHDAVDSYLRSSRIG
jgi:DNA-binding response OmpR family regulator